MTADARRSCQSVLKQGLGPPPGFQSLRARSAAEALVDYSNAQSAELNRSSLHQFKDSFCYVREQDDYEVLRALLGSTNIRVQLATSPDLRPLQASYTGCLGLLRQAVGLLYRGILKAVRIGLGPVFSLIILGNWPLSPRNRALWVLTACLFTYTIVGHVLLNSLHIRHVVFKGLLSGIWTIWDELSLRPAWWMLLGSVMLRMVIAGPSDRWEQTCGVLSVLVLWSCLDHLGHCH